MYVQVLQVATNLIFSYSGRDFAPPFPVLQSIHSRGMGREVASEDWGKKIVEYLTRRWLSHDICKIYDRQVCLLSVIKSKLISPAEESHNSYSVFL